MSNARTTENSGFLDGQDYTAAFLYEFCALLVGNGVYAGELAPTATNDNMTITHGAGHAWINGVLYKNTTPINLGVDTADGSLNRYDSLMLRLDLSANETYAVIVKGEFAASPTPPAVTRNAETYDLKICDIWIPAGCTKITQAQIRDTRLNSAVCGVPVFPVEHLDMTRFYNQIATDLAEFKNNHQASFAKWVADQKRGNLETIAALVKVVQDTETESRAEILNVLQGFKDYTDGLKTKGDTDLATITEAFLNYTKERKTEFTAWFEGIREQLSGDVAGNLALRTEKLEEDTALLNAMVMNNEFFAPILDSTGAPILCSDGEALVGSWKYLFA